MDISDIGSLWDSFFYPIFNTAIIVTATVFILGRDKAKEIIRKIAFRIDGFVFTKKEKAKQTSDEQSALPKIYKPLRKAIGEAVKKPMSWLFVLFLLSFAVNKFSIFYSNHFFPFSYSLRSDIIMALKVEPVVLAEIWTHFPNDSFETLCRRIVDIGKESSYVKYSDISFVYNLNRVFQFIALTATVVLFITVVKFLIRKIKGKNRSGNTKKMVIRCIAVMLVSLMLVCGLLYLQYLKTENEYIESAHYTLSKLKLENETEPITFQTYYNNVEQEIAYAKADKTCLVRGFDYCFLSFIR